MRIQVANTSYEEIEKTLLDLLKERGKLSITLIYADQRYKAETRRLFVTGGTLGIYRPGAHRWGYRFTKHTLNGVASLLIPDKRDTLPEVIWRRGWEKVLARLQASGLFADTYAKEVATALAVGYEKIRQAYKVYWTASLEADDNVTTNSIRAIDPRLIKVLDDGREVPDTGVIWYMKEPPKVKKMYFGKYDNEHSLAKIAQAMENKTPLNIYERANYDVSFQYSPDQGRAWYSEEYKNAGNGHYYLALDATHAIFYEDD